MVPRKRPQTWTLVVYVLVVPKNYIICTRNLLFSVKSMQMQGWPHNIPVSKETIVDRAVKFCGGRSQSYYDKVSSTCQL